MVICRELIVPVAIGCGFRKNGVALATKSDVVQLVAKMQSVTESYFTENARILQVCALTPGTAKEHSKVLCSNLEGN